MVSKSDSISRRLTSLMKEKKMTLAMASKVSGIAKSTIQSWRTGSSPTDFEGLKKLADSLGVSLEFVLTGEDSKQNNGKEITLAEAFQCEEPLFDGFCKVSITRLIPRDKKK